MVADVEFISCHRETLVAFSKPGKCLEPRAPTATVNQAKWFEADGPTLERRKLQQRILNEWRERTPNVVRDRQAVVLAGPPGAGKSTALSQVLAERGQSLDLWRVIDADVFKDALLRQAVVDGSFEAMLKPQQVKDLEARGERFYPRELASLVHEESSQLARQARAMSIRQGENIVIDSVLSGQRTAQDIGDLLADAGYEVEVVDVEVSYGVSAESISRRWESGYRAELEGHGDGLGGRWVPSEYAHQVFGRDDGKSWPEVVSRRLAESCPAVSRFRRYRREDGTDGRVEPTLTVDLSRRVPGGVLQPTRDDVGDVRQLLAAAFPRPVTAGLDVSSGQSVVAPNRVPPRGRDVPGVER